MKDNFIIIETEDGDEQEYEILDVISYERKPYAILFPTDEYWNDEDEVTVAEIVMDMDDIKELKFEVPDDICCFVFEEFKNKHKDDYIFIDAM